VDDARVVHDPDERLFQLVTAEDEVAGYAEYVPTEGALAVMHVVVRPEFGGRGYGTRLAEAAVDEAREQGLGLLPYCSFLLDHVRRRPDAIALVPEQARRRFGLAV
jgi:hypothetical protein